MTISRPTAFAAGAVVALVVGSGTAVAATGGNFLLGKSNSAQATTTLKNTKGTALQVTSRPGTPSLKVSNTVKIPNLNADRLDGIDSRSFALANGQTNTVSGFPISLDVDEDGFNETAASLATCPAGTKLTGGGGDDVTNDGTLFINSPLDRTSWLVVSSTSDAFAGSSVRAYAVCYNPRGSVLGAEFRSAPTRPTKATMALIEQRVAKKFD